MASFRISTAALGTSAAAWVLLVAGFAAARLFASSHAAPLAVMSPRTFAEVAALWVSGLIAIVGVALSVVSLAARERTRNAWLGLLLGSALAVPLVVLIVVRAA